MYSDRIATITIHLLKVLILAQQMVILKTGDFSLSHGWWDRFRLRHPQVTLRKPEKLSKARMIATDRVVLNNYFDM